MSRASALHCGLAALVALALPGCSSAPSKEEQEAAKNTFACQTSAGERIVIRFDRGEARLLMADGERVTLYQVPSGSGVRYTNGTMDLFGKGLDLSLGREGNAPRPLEACAQYTPPKDS